MNRARGALLLCAAIACAHAAIACGHKDAARSAPVERVPAAANAGSAKDDAIRPEPAGAAPKPPIAPPDDMVSIPAATFFMGIEPGDHGMEVGKLTSVAAFFIDKHEVTSEQYAACVRDAHCSAVASKQAGCNRSIAKTARHPINCVDWYQADRYCRALGKRLPTESEWELAARGTDRRLYPWGNDPPAEQLCWQGRRGKQDARTCPVGGFPAGASAYGVLDMAGNVAEWTGSEDTQSYGRSYLVKGGGYVLDPMESPEWRSTRVDMTFAPPSAHRQPWLGFRCARDASARK